MKRLLLILVIFTFSKSLFAEHITGGEMYYTFLGMQGSNYQYRITLKLYRDCNSPGAQLDVSAPIGIFNRNNNSILSTTLVNRTRIETLELSSPGPCIVNAPIVCYQVGYYEFTVALPGTASGYVVSYQRCCRINGISNVVASGSNGATYTAIIPGTNAGADAPMNSSAKFRGIDTVIVCGGYPFLYNFGATDPDRSDVLRYQFCNAYQGGGPTQGTGPGNSTPNPPANPPYPTVSYGFPYSGSNPLGADVHIDPNTGIITGNAPPQGIYVVTVCVSEIRNGVVIATQRKDLQIKAGGCDIAKPVLKPEYISCDGFTLNFTQPSNSLIHSYYWEFGDPASGANNSSAVQNPPHTFSAPGVYTIKLVANRGEECSDSSTAIVRVWPGFFPAFTNVGVCRLNPVQFNDGTTATYGTVNNWQWDFDDATISPEDTSTTRNPSWNYSSAGVKNVRLIVGSDLGCVDTLIKQVAIIDKPPITLAFRDTLICVPDHLVLQASGTGIFNWTPLQNISNSNTPTPTVNPATSTLYFVHLNQDGCVNTDSVNVRVVDHVTISIMGDSTICLTDAAQINVTSDGLHYDWTPAATLNDATLQDPIATPTGLTTYQVIAHIGSCSATRDVTITPVPYPMANAGPDTTICYNTSVQLHGSHDGRSFNWSPVSTLTNPNTLQPIAFPAGVINPYVLTSFDTRGCPKPGRDTVVITVLPKIIPYAGRDTLVVVGQPLQLNAEGGVTYSWSPPTGLNDPNIKNPLAIYGAEIDSVRYIVRVYNEVGCYDSVFKKVTVFKTNPYVFVPTAFTPNGDGLNDVLRPIAVGVARINYFQIYNRWGQLLFSTTTNEEGWDGRIAGVLQGSNVFVWMVKATDYLGKPIFLKGTSTLIR